MLLGAAKEHRLLPALPKAILAGLLFLACIAPWMARNWSTFHAFIPMRGNFGAELYSSLLEGNNGFSWGPTVPVYDRAPEYLRYKALGEHAYVLDHGTQAVGGGNGLQPRNTESHHENVRRTDGAGRRGKPG